MKLKAILLLPLCLPGETVDRLIHTAGTKQQGDQIMVKFQKIGVLSFGRLNAVLMALIGLVVGMLYSFGGAIIDGLVSAGWVTSSETPGLAYGTVLAFGAIIGIPVLFSLIGFAYGAVAAALFNVAARSVGGCIRTLIGEVRMDFK